MEKMTYHQNMLNNTFSDQPFLLSNDFCNIVTQISLEESNTSYTQKQQDECLYNSIDINYFLAFFMLLMVAFIILFYLKIMQDKKECFYFEKISSKSTIGTNKDQKTIIEKRNKILNASQKIKALVLLSFCFPLFFLYVQLSNGPTFIYTKLKRSEIGVKTCPNGIDLMNTQLNNSLPFKISNVNNSELKMLEQTSILCLNGQKWNLKNKKFLKIQNMRSNLELVYEKNPENSIDTKLVSMYFLSGFLTPLIYEKLKQKFKSYNIYLFSSFIVGACSICFGYLSKENIALLFIIRLIHGLMGSIVLTQLSIYIKRYFRNTGTALKEIVSDSGYIAAPLFGYQLMKQSDPFVQSGALFIFFSIFTLIFLIYEKRKIKIQKNENVQKKKQKSINIFFCFEKKDQNNQDIEVETAKLNEVLKAQFGLMALLRFKTVIIQYTIIFILNFCVQSFFASFTEYLQGVHKIFDNEIAVVFVCDTLGALVSALSIMFINALLQEFKENEHDNKFFIKLQKLIIIIGAFCVAICYLSYYFIGTNTLAVKILNVIIGSGSMFATIPNVDVMTYDIIEYLKNKEHNKNEIFCELTCCISKDMQLKNGKNQSSIQEDLKNQNLQKPAMDILEENLIIIYGMVQCIGQFCGPFIGGQIVKNTSFVTNSLLIGFFVLIQSIIFFCRLWNEKYAIVKREKLYTKIENSSNKPSQVLSNYFY